MRSPASLSGSPDAGTFEGGYSSDETRCVEHGVAKRSFTSDGGSVAIKDPSDRVRGPKPPWKKQNPTVEERLELIKIGLTDLEADIVVVVEGPNKTEELQLLFDTVADGSWTCYILPSRYQLYPDKNRKKASSQCLGIAVRQDAALFKNPSFTSFDSEDVASGLIYEASEPFFFRYW